MKIAVVIFYVDEVIKRAVRHHINSIPSKESHSYKKHSIREFFNEGKTLLDLHRGSCNQDQRDRPKRINEGLVDFQRRKYVER